MVKSIYAGTEKDRDRQIPPFFAAAQSPLQPGSFGVGARALVPSADTDYQYTCVETAVAPRTLGPSPHYHKYLDELALVLDGTLSVLVEDTVYDAPAGSMVFRPRGMIHTFWNATDEPIRFLDMFFNQNFDEYLEEFFRLIGGGADESVDETLTEQLQALDAEFDTVVYHDQRQSILDKYGLNG